MMSFVKQPPPTLSSYLEQTLLLSFPHHLFDRTPFPQLLWLLMLSNTQRYFSLENCPCLTGVTLHGVTCEFMPLPPTSRAGDSIWLIMPGPLVPRCTNSVIFIMLQSSLWGQAEARFQPHFAWLFFFFFLFFLLSYGFMLWGLFPRNPSTNHLHKPPVSNYVWGAQPKTVTESETHNITDGCWFLTQNY